MKPYDANVWILIERAADLPGEWVAHCLDFDVVTQGSSMHQAFEMVLDAVRMVVEEDVASGREPMERRAPKECWARLWNAMKHAHKLPAGTPFTRHDRNVAQLLVQLAVHVACDDKRPVVQQDVPLAMVSNEAEAAA
jgi:hypothetical protein